RGGPGRPGRRRLGSMGFFVSLVTRRDRGAAARRSTGGVAMRKLPSELAAVALVLALGLPSSASSQSGLDWQVLVGRETDDHAIQAQAYFPIVITVVAGDTITWNLGGLNSHTVTFLSGQ